MNTPPTPKLDDDSGRDYVYLVVGYRDCYLTTRYPEMKMYGLYKTKEEARERIHILTGIMGKNIANGNWKRCWINRVHFGDFERLPNSGAFDKL
jgi:hypothetical protein